MQSDSAFARSIAEAARTLNQPRSLDETLQTIVEVACNSVPGFDQVGIATLHKKGTVETRAFTGDLVLRLDEAQYGLREGPCSAVLAGRRSGIRVESPSTSSGGPGTSRKRRQKASGRRWRSSCTSIEDALGGINFYSTISDDVSPDAQALAQLFASHAAIALGHAHERESLNEALQTRKVIGEAIGILMERHAMNEDRAFAFLVRASSHANIKLRAVAQELVNERNNT